MTQARLLLDHHLLTQRDIQVKFLDQEFQEPNLEEKKLFPFTSMSKIKRTSMVQDKHLKIIVRDTL